MVFVVKKTINGCDYYYLRKSARVEGKVKAINVAYLGKCKNKTDALRKAKDYKLLNKKDIMSNKTNENKAINESVVSGEDIVAVASTRGFFFPTASIYGGRAGFYTYGHLGKLIKNKWEKLWKGFFLDEDNHYEIQSNNILPEKVFRASGHIDHFSDKMVSCPKCKSEFHKELLPNNKCLKCNTIIEKVEGEDFNMMFPLTVGRDEVSFLSPETAQGSYISFKQEFEATRRKLPLGLAIIDKAYRNEISPRQLFFRLREFTQAELQLFFDPEKVDVLDDDKWNAIKDYNLLLKLVKGDNIVEVSCFDANKKLGIPRLYVFALSKIQRFYLDLIGIPKSKFRFFEVSSDDRAHYNKIQFDIEIFLNSLGDFKEVAGLHYRSDYDLSRHQKVSGVKHEVFFDGKRILPHVLEWSFGVDRNIWALFDVFSRVNKDKSDTIVFNFPSQVSPFHVSVLPLVNKDGLDSLALDIHNSLKKDFDSFFDKSGSIGRRYARNDEVGTPFCITVDHDSLKDNDVTIRFRDSGKQIRVKISKLKDKLNDLLGL